MHSHLYPVVLFADDMGTLDIVSRLRLSKLLDVGNKWEQLASALGKIWIIGDKYNFAYLGCEHMIEFIQVCADTSPTHLLLDQYEVLVNGTYIW